MKHPRNRNAQLRTRLSRRECQDCQHWRTQQHAATIGRCMAVPKLKIACADEPCDIDQFKLKT